VEWDNIMKIGDKVIAKIKREKFAEQKRYFI
jgi:hypothetical protein